MKNLVVFAHPNQKSFCSAILETILKTSKTKGDEVIVRDLYQINFDPVLKSSDFEAFERGETPKDILKEQKYIKWADIITFIYPVWWGSTPAIMQGYVDRVFAHDFAYKCESGQVIGLLDGKKAVLFSTLGNSKEEYDKTGMTEAMIQTKDEVIFKFCGINEVTHIFFSQVPAVKSETLKEYLKEVERVIKNQ